MASFKPPPEKDVQRAVMYLFRAAGFTVRSTSQYRESRVALGLPDLMCHHRARGLFCWFEVKASQPNGYHPLERATWHPRPLSPHQRVFQEDAIACGQHHFWGGLPEAEAALIDLGCARRAGNGALLLSARVNMEVSQ